ncbi:hypothetical protein [Roseinatronobacter bogoriensis]|uniref:hypothetical protein n=1 Tax=Roseinatronobacter bogoriensis TaxID=119542 RepID=UPI0012FD23C6|nr:MULTISPECIES: hypothetical protein [Rhodobaca]MBB4209255.1 hypothetical protein [Rhodobaca bogoriensis DSM 18756]
MRFGMQDHLSGGTSIFARIMMSEIQVQDFLEVPQSAATIPFQFGPGPSRDHDTVCTVKIRLGDPASPAGGIAASDWRKVERRMLP